MYTHTYIYTPYIMYNIQIVQPSKIKNNFSNIESVFTKNSFCNFATQNFEVRIKN